MFFRKIEILLINKKGDNEMKPLETSRLILRSLTLNDAPKVEEYASDYDVAKTTLNIPHPYPEGEQGSLLQASWKQRETVKLRFSPLRKKRIIA